MPSSRLAGVRLAVMGTRRQVLAPRNLITRQTVGDLCGLRVLVRHFYGSLDRKRGRGAGDGCGYSGPFAGNEAYRLIC
jgi:hypothetical protein